MANKAVGYLTFNFGANMGGFNRAMKKAQMKVKRFGKSMKRVGRSMTTGLTLPIIALGAVAVKTFANFEQAMLKVKAVSGATSQEFESLVNNAKRLGSSTMFTATQVAGLQFELAKLGFDTASINDSTEAILQLSQATGHDLAESGEIVAATLNSFNLETKDAIKVADIFAVASSNAAMDMEKLSVAMPTVGATANAVGVPLETLTSMMMTLADSGMEASTMGTHLRKIFVELATKGVSFEDAMNGINASTDKVTTATRLFGKRAFGAGLILAANTKKTSDYNDEIDKAAGKSKEMADIMDSGVSGKLRKLTSRLEGVAISLGELLIPVVEKIIKFVMDSIGVWNQIDGTFKNVIITIAILVAGIGALLTVFGSLSIALSAILSPIGLVISGLAVLGGAIIWIYNNIDALTTLIANKFANKFDASFWSAMGAAMKVMGIAGGDALLTLGTKMAIVVATGEDLPQQEWVSFTDIIKNAASALAGFSGIKLGGGTSKSKEGEEKSQTDLSGTLIAAPFIGPLEQINEQSEAVLNLSGAYKGLGDAISSSMQQAMTSQSNFFSSFIENIKKAVGQMMAMLAAQLFIQSLLGGTAIGTAMGLKGGGLQGILDSVFPAFASGGLVTGPTAALIGEGPGTSASNPEVVAPLDKLKSMIGEGTQQVEVFGRLSGNDIWLSNSKTGITRNRAL